MKEEFNQAELKNKKAHERRRVRSFGVESAKYQGDGPVLMNSGEVYFNSEDSIYHWNNGDHIIEKVYTLPTGGAFSGMEKGPDGSLYASNYRKHEIVKFPVGKDGKPDFKQGSVVFKSDKLGQPNDFVVLKSGNFLFADHSPNLSKKKAAILWGNRENGEVIKVTLSPANFVGIDYDQKRKQIYATVSSNKTNALLIYEFEEGEFLKTSKLMRPKCVRRFDEAWSLDGVSHEPDTGHIFVTRITLGVVEVFARDGDEILTAGLEPLCLMEDYKCDGKGIEMAKIQEEKFQAINPSDVVFDESNRRLVITSFGMSGQRVDVGANKAHLVFYDLSQ